MRITHHIRDSIGAIDRLAMAIRALAASITELARAINRSNR